MLLHRNLAALYTPGILCIDDPALDEAEALDFGDDERLQMGWRWKSWSAGAEANPCMAWNRRGARLDGPVCQGGGRGLQEHWALRDDGIPQVRLSGLLGPSGRLICCPPETAKNPFVPPLMRCSLFFGFPIHPQKVDTWIPGVQMMPPMTGPSVLRRMAPSTISCTRLEHLAARIASASVDSSPHG